MSPIQVESLTEADLEAFDKLPSASQSYEARRTGLRAETKNWRSGSHAKAQKRQYDASRAGLRELVKDWRSGKKPYSSRTPEQRRIYDASRAALRELTNDWRSGKHQAKFLAPIVAWDSESATDHHHTPEHPYCTYVGEQSLEEIRTIKVPTCNHRCIAVVNSTGETIRATPGGRLTTEDWLNFLLSANPKLLHVGFSLNYDVTMFIKDLPHALLRQLHATGKIKWGDYQIEYHPRSNLIVRWGSYFKRGQNGLIKRAKSRAPKTFWQKSTIIWDVWKFYQQSFVAGLIEWDIGTPELRKKIADMKEDRGEFSDEDPARVDEIIEYSVSECRLLVELFEELRKTLVELELIPNRADGAGALASTMFQQNNVKQYLAAPPLAVKDYVMGAYYGANIQTNGAGYISDCFSYDINSAYPYWQMQLPCLKHMEYVRTNKYDPDAEYAIWDVEWRIEEALLWGPFPYRHKRTINYPLQGKGFYHASEVRAAIRYYGPECFTIRGGLLLKPGCNEKPFAWIEEKYRQRLKLAEPPYNPAEKPLKKALAAMYGKTAQGLGHGDNPPPYQSYVWAGMITAGCRSQILDAISRDPSAIFGIFTDAIFTQGPLEGLASKEKKLGSWKEGSVPQVFLVQPGVYICKVIDCGDSKHPIELHWCEHYCKTRGFSPREVDWNEIRATFDANCYGTYKYKATRFVTLGAAIALAGPDENAPLSLLGSWLTQERELKLKPSRRHIWEIDHENPPVRSGLRWVPHRIIERVRVDPEYSDIYVPKQTWDESWDTSDEMRFYEQLEAEF